MLTSFDRSLPDLDVVEESSLLSILRWNAKTNMVKTMSSSDNGQIALVTLFLLFVSTQVLSTFNISVEILMLWCYR